MSEEKKADGAFEVLYDFKGCRVRNISKRVSSFEFLVPSWVRDALKSLSSTKICSKRSRYDAFK